MSTHEEAVQDIKKAKSVLDAHVPDNKKFFTHTSVSMIKSGFRIAAGLALAGGGWLESNPYIQAAGIVLVLAEILGIVEELV
jgi:transketolase N-terminal domain/subunit